MNIVVFDDDPIVMQALVIGVGALGHSAEGLSQWPADVSQIEQCDLVFTDINMPGADGFEILRRVKQIGSHIRVIAVTGEAMPQAERLLATADFDGLLRKPYSVSELADILADQA